MEISTVLYGLALASFFILLAVAFATPVLKKYNALEHVQEPEDAPTSPVNSHIGETHTMGEWEEIWRSERTSAPTSEAADARRSDGTQQAYMIYLEEKHRKSYGTLRDAEAEEKVAAQGEHAL